MSSVVASVDEARGRYRVDQRGQLWRREGGVYDSAVKEYAGRGIAGGEGFTGLHLGTLQQGEGSGGTKDASAAMVRLLKKTCRLLREASSPVILLEYLLRGSCSIFGIMKHSISRVRV
jgi:hypothetical protein